MKISRKKRRIKLGQELNSTSGFSLVELVVAVGVLAILAVLGVIFFRGLNDNARQSTVDNAVATVFKSVLTKSAAAGKYGNPLEADTEWMNSAGKDNRVTVDVLPLDGGNYEVRGHYGDGAFEDSKIKSVKRTDSKDGSTPGDSSNPGGIIGADPLFSSFTFVCDETSTGFLPISNINMSSTKVMMIENNGTPEPVEYSENLDGKNYFRMGNGPSFDLSNVSSQIQMKAGVEYKIQIEGTYEALAHIDSNGNNLGSCLKSINSLGDDSGLKSINQLLGDGIGSVSFPSSIPNSVESLSFAFAYLVIDEASPIEGWDISNVKDSSRAFRMTKIKSDLDLSGWDTSNLSNAGEMFAQAVIDGNLNLNNWTAPAERGSILANTEAESLSMDNWEVNNISEYSSPIAHSLKIDNITMDNWTITNIEVNPMPLIVAQETPIRSMDNWTIENSTISGGNLIIGLNIHSMNDWTISNSTINASILSSGVIVETDVNNWTLDNTTVNRPVMPGGTINGNMNDWTIQDTIFDYTPLMSGVTINGNMNNWTIQNVNEPAWVFERTATTVNGSRTGWTLDGSPM